ncbi:MAG: NADH-quinone oxidoreductase subunit J [Chloroflexi bacterium]|nr:NADH-quinone oxidoreductase subunit J [Chloroflexota bacterium]
MTPFLLFAVMALVALIGAVGVVFSRSAVHSALYLLLNFASIAGMYILLGAQFLGVVQIIVYAGAIIVLFLFVIMLIGGHTSDIRGGSRRYARVVGTVLTAVFLLAIVFIIGQSIPVDTVAKGAPGDGSVQALGSVLYTTYLLPFELASILLLAGMLGGVVLARSYKDLNEERI